MCVSDGGCVVACVSCLMCARVGGWWCGVVGVLDVCVCHTWCVCLCGAMVVVCVILDVYVVVVVWWEGCVCVCHT